jgi:hypothetical protein
MLRNLSLTFLALLSTFQLNAQPTSFSLREMDMHLHAGMERDVDLNKWVDLAAADGRRVLLLLDHLELYRRKTPGLYLMGAAGHAALMADFDAQKARRKDLIIFKGWEILEDELDTGLETAPMRMADVLGWHISWSREEAPNGQLLIRRVKQLRELRKQFPVPMILFHPFAARIRKLQDVAKAQGRDPRTITTAEYRFFQAGEQAELAALLKNSSIYIEISYSNASFIKDPACREALIADVKPLSDAGVQFTVSTDAHKLKSTERQFHPEGYCAPLGVTPENTNEIVRELLAGRNANRRLKLQDGIR